MPVRTGPIAYKQLTADIEKAIRKLPKEVVRVRYSFGMDSTDEPAIYFRVVISDAASREDVLFKVTSRIEKILSEQIRPLEDWGMLAYFNFRNQSEQKELNDPDWA